MTKNTSISPYHEQKLRWYFSLGIAAFEFSTFGYQIDSAMLLNAGSFPCRHCGGDGISGDAAYAVLCKHCGGRGVKEGRVYGSTLSHFGTSECQLCSGVCGNDDCPKCGGDGYIESLAVFETGDDPHMIHEPDESQLKAYGEVARILSRLSNKHQLVLERFYGDIGERWAQTDRGRLFSLYDLTKAGEELLETFAKATEACLRPVERIGVAATLEKTKSVERRRQLLASALLQASKMYSGAASAFMRIAEPETTERAA